MVTTAVHRPRAWRGLRTIPAGVDPEAPAMVYLVANDSRRSLRVGVAGVASGELDDLESLGWRVVTTWWFDLGFDALEVEECLLDRWRNLFSLRPRLESHDALDGDAVMTVRSSPETEHDATRFVDARCRELADDAEADDAEGDERAGWFRPPDPWLLAS